MPPASFTQATFSPSLFCGVGGAHFSGRFFSRLTPFCSGPRHWYQSLALTEAKDAARITTTNHDAGVLMCIRVPLTHHRMVVKSSTTAGGYLFPYKSACLQFETGQRAGSNCNNVGSKTQRL